MIFNPAQDRDAADAVTFREQCRRPMARPMAARMKYGFCRVYRPLPDTPGVRSFESTKEYRKWCAAHLPAYLGFQPAPAEWTSACRLTTASSQFW